MAQINNIVSIYDVIEEAINTAHAFGQRSAISNFQQIALDNLIETASTTTVDQKDIDQERYRKIYSYKRNRSRLG